jgi:hypothetical protein
LRKPLLLRTKNATMLKMRNATERTSSKKLP